MKPIIYCARGEDSVKIQQMKYEKIVSSKSKDN